MSKRTKKLFVDYNEYRDRPFGLKWGPAFTIEELKKGINENKKEAMKDIKLLPQMEINIIDQLLSESFLYQKIIRIQLNLRDDLGRPVESIEGVFNGEAYEDYFVFNEQIIFWEDVRNIYITEQKKWFTID